MNSTKPYLIRAFYEWIVDNNCTPYIVVNADSDGVSVPPQYVDNGQIILNISMNAASNLKLDNEEITFSARFAGVVYEIIIPVKAVLAIYARENGRGMVFAEEEPPTPPSPETDGSEKDGKKGKSGKGKGKGKPNLTIVK